MPPINVLVTTTSSHFWAEVIAESVDARPDMNLVENRWVGLVEVDQILASLEPSSLCAMVLVGSSDELIEAANRWVRERDGLVVMYVDMGDDIVRIGLRDPRLESILSALHELAESAGTQNLDRVASIQLRLVESAMEAEETGKPAITESRPLLNASIDWVHSVFINAIASVPDDNGDVHGLSVTRETILESLAQTSEPVPDQPQSQLEEPSELDIELARSYRSPEHLAVAARVFGLDALEFRLMLLVLAPELDTRFQRSIGFLLDEMGRRVGTMGLYCSLLGIDPQVRGELIYGGSLTRWLVFDGYGGRPAAADEPLRPDLFLAQWLLGDPTALENDPRVRRAMQLVAWPGSRFLARPEEVAKAVALIEEIQDRSSTDWLILNGDDSANWGALLELGAVHKKLKPIRIDVMRLVNVDLLEVEECARRIGRMARLTADPLVIDATKAALDIEGEGLRTFFTALQNMECRPVVICRDRANIARLLGAVGYEIKNEPALPAAGRVAATLAAAADAGVVISTENAQALTDLYPLHVDGLEYAVNLARGYRSKDSSTSEATLAALTSALKESAAHGISHLIDRIEPIFSIDQVVLPPDRVQQLTEIVEHVRLAQQVLDGWKFREQLPYGRGVSALFFGASGTGKTMAAMGIARELGIQILRLDLSRVVSKYIGDTEKNLDRVFTDAQSSGAAILIDEADALFGKRSEVKDAHDRYANIEVAYLLQRMEAFDGLAILTTNMKKNLDQAFTRRLRFMIEFPRPDADAREQIWRQCLPEESHEISDREFRQLARRIDLTGGQIRQTTLRAAFIAAAAGRRINIEHIAHATNAELAKLGMPPVDIDLKQLRRAA